MRTLLVDADSHNGFPNLALMKISEWYKRLGHDVDLIQGIPSTAPLSQDYDKVYISCIFLQNKEKVLDYAAQFTIPVELGGSGLSLETKLHEPIEHMMPDYSLYGIDYSMGFTSRGCIRKCSFCVVPKKEGYICDHAPIEEFLHPDHKKLILLDNNFQASPKWEENIQFIIDKKLKVNVNQGLDIRLMNEEFAGYLKKAKTFNRKFTKRSFHIAFDSPKLERPFRKGMRTLLDAKITASNIMVYILCGHDTFHYEDKYRFDVVKEYGAIPFIMPYNQTEDQWIRQFARWVNGRYYQFIPFEDYLDGVLIL